MEPRYYLGVDVGGTKTHAMLADAECRIRGFGEAGPGNHEGVGYPGLEAALAQAVGACLRDAGATIEQVAGAGFGVGGYDWPCEREATLNAIRTLGIGAPVDAVNDAVLGLLAGAAAGWGLAVVGGTGCNCWGLDARGRTAHVTGAGARLGEAAGAGELVDEAIARVSRFWSRRGPATRLAQAFIEYTGAKDLDDLIEGLVMERYEISTRAAPLVFQVAENRDAVACEVVAWAGAALGDLACGVIRQLELEGEAFDVILVGSLYNGGPLLIDPMRQTIQRVAPRARLVKLEGPPVAGAILLGMQQAGLDTASRREALLAAARDQLT
jgi:N-acetylglucosamine kinase-like BadF-type ATPase